MTSVFRLALIACDQDRESAIAACIGAFIALADMADDRREVIERAERSLASTRRLIELMTAVPS